MSNEEDIIAKVNSQIKRELNKNKDKIKNAQIRPISKQWPFSTNGIYFFCSKMGGGKTYTIMKHIMVTDQLFDKPYYDLIIFTSTSGSMDKTVESLKSQVQSKIVFVKDSELMKFLDKHLRDKLKYYAVAEFINSNGKEVNETMKHIIDKHKFYRLVKGERTYDMKKIALYMVDKMTKWGFDNIPTNTLLVMDDFAGHPLLKDVNSPLSRLLTKTRHYHLTAILAVQSWRFVNLNFKRLCTDIIVWKGYSEEDFKMMCKQTPNDKPWEELWEQYKNLPDQHSHMILHINTSDVVFEEK